MRVSGWTFCGRFHLEIGKRPSKLSEVSNRSKLGLAVLLVIIAPLAGWVAIDAALRARAKPPSNVINVASCLAWLNNPLGVYRITSNESVYYQIIGPAGRLVASGPAGYTFDREGKLIGWSEDVGDDKTPAQVFAKDRKLEKISISELQSDLKKQSL